MSQQTINIGSAPNDFTGDPLRTAFTKINSNFTELYPLITGANPMTTIGDIIQGTTAGAAQRLAAVAAGNVLISGGVATLNSWGKVGLGTHVSGNLPIGNLNNGSGASSSTFWRGDGTWAAPNGIFSGSIAGTQVAYGLGLNALTGESAFTYDDTGDVLRAGISLEQIASDNSVKTSYNVYSIQATKLTIGPTDFQFNGATGINASRNGGGINITAGSAHSVGDGFGGNIILSPGAGHGTGPQGAVYINNGINNSGSGFKHQRFGTGPVAGSSVASIVFTWSTPFLDANYDVYGTIVDLNAPLGLVFLRVTSKTASQVTAIIQNTDAAPITGELHLLGVHDG